MRHDLRYSMYFTSLHIVYVQCSECTSVYNWVYRWKGESVWLELISAPCCMLRDLKYRDNWGQWWVGVLVNWRWESCERRPRGEVCIAASVRGAEREAAHIGAQHTLRCGGRASGRGRAHLKAVSEWLRGELGGGGTKWRECS